MDFKQDTRGFRNNNPGNIRHGNDWKGEEEGYDKAFETFKSVEYGIRAIHVLLNTFSKHYALNTIEGIINRYAPPNENHTTQYINSVYQYMFDNALADQAAYLHREKTKADINEFNLKPLFIGGIILVENGFQPFNFEFIKECENVCDN